MAAEISEWIYKVLILRNSKAKKKKKVQTQ